VTAAEAGVRALLEAVTDDVDRPGLADTPARVVAALRELTSGMTVDVAGLLARQFPEADADEMIVLTGIDFVSICEHHLMPFAGTATVAYLPAGPCVVGLSKLARVVDAYARRLQVQERLTTQITTALDKHLMTRGSAAMLTATHACMALRGAHKPTARMVTASLTGAFREDGRARAEFLALART
jgi:GTP cyclohydrolase I